MTTNNLMEIVRRSLNQYSNEPSTCIDCGVIDAKIDRTKGKSRCYDCHSLYLKEGLADGTLFLCDGAFRKAHIVEETEFIVSRNEDVVYSHWIDEQKKPFFLEKNIALFDIIVETVEEYDNYERPYYIQREVPVAVTLELCPQCMKEALA